MAKLKLILKKYFPTIVLREQYGKPNNFLVHAMWNNADILQYFPLLLDWQARDYPVNIFISTALVQTYLFFQPSAFQTCHQ